MSVAIKGFDYQSFVKELSAEADEFIPAEFQDFQKQYVAETIVKYSLLVGEAVYKDKESNFTAVKAKFITQLVSEWTFHKSIDIIKAGIPTDYWDEIMEMMSLSTWAVTRYAISEGSSDKETLQIVEKFINKAYRAILIDLETRKIIDKVVLDRALSQSNIDEMNKQVQKH